MKLLNSTILLCFLFWSNIQSMINDGKNISISSGTSLGIRSDLKYPSIEFKNLRLIKIAEDRKMNNTTEVIVAENKDSTVFEVSNIREIRESQSPHFNNPETKTNENLLADENVSQFLHTIDNKMNIKNNKPKFQATSLLQAFLDHNVITEESGKVKMENTVNRHFPIATSSSYKPRSIINNTDVDEFSVNLLSRRAEFHLNYWAIYKIQKN